MFSCSRRSATCLRLRTTTDCSPENVTVVATIWLPPPFLYLRELQPKSRALTQFRHHRNGNRIPEYPSRCQSHAAAECIERICKSHDKRIQFQRSTTPQGEHIGRRPEPERTRQELLESKPHSQNRLPKDFNERSFLKLALGQM